MGHKWLKKKRVSLVEKNVRKTERFFDNHYRIDPEIASLHFAAFPLKSVKPSASLFSGIPQPLSPAASVPPADEKP